MLSDLILFNKIKKGDIGSFESIFRKYYLPLYYYSLSIVNDSNTAEEVIQELFYIVWKNREKIQIRQSLNSYLYQSVLNNSLQYLKHHSLREEYNNYVKNESESSYSSIPDNEMEYKELNKIINDTLAKLPDRRRKIYLLHKEEQFKYKEIADKLSLSIKTIESEMTKTYKELKREIEKYIK